MPRIVAIGECMIELSGGVGDRWRLGFGGDTYNTAAHLANLGGDVSYLTAIGDDGFSADMRAQFEDRGIDTGLVLSAATHHPGLYAIRTGEGGERSFTYWRDSSAARRLFDLPGIDAALDAASAADLLYLSGITLSLYRPEERARLAAVAASVRAAGGIVAFDPNYRPGGWPDAEGARLAIADFARHVSIALPTFEDEQLLYDDATPAASAERWVAAGAGEVVVKLGAAGCQLTGGGESGVISPVAPILPVDTTGAGDSFNAAYLYARLRGLTPRVAAYAGNRLAGEVIQFRGALR